MEHSRHVDTRSKRAHKGAVGDRQDNDVLFPPRPILGIICLGWLDKQLLYICRNRHDIVVWGMKNLIVESKTQQSGGVTVGMQENENKLKEAVWRKMTLFEMAKGWKNEYECECE